MNIMKNNTISLKDTYNKGEIDYISLGSLFLGIGIFIFFTFFYPFIDFYPQDMKVKADCLTTIDKIQSYYGEIPTYVQWSRFSSFTHQEQCSEYIP